MSGLRTRSDGARFLRSSSEQQRPRSPGVAYAAVTLALSVVVGAMALTSRQSAPPTIAEFAPQAVEQITDPSGDLAATRRGASGETSQPDDEADVGGGTRQTVAVARVRQCVGDPPRQIEDPQSPPCVPHWSGDNGGATSHGVSRDEIRVVEGFSNSSWSPALEAFFNSRFEFYGREIRLIPRPGGGDPAGQRAAARAAYERDQAFASVGFGTEWAYLDELARVGILGVHYQPIFPEPYMASRRPYLWTYPMANDRLFATVGNWYCARFAGRDAVHAGDPLLQASRRKAGIILIQAGWEGTSTEPMNTQLASCGSHTSAVVRGTDHNWDLAYYEGFMENAVLQMKTSGVTSLACLCHALFVGPAMRAATNQAYFPEWLLTDYLTNNEMAYARLFHGAPQQSKSLMLLLADPMQRPYADHPSNWAVQEAGNTDYPATSLNQNDQDIKYRDLLLLASGIQMAGPHLTPETFERGLHTTRFPNPAHRNMAGAVGFGGVGGWDEPDHSMTDDVVEIWWSNTARSPYSDDPPGTFCYVGHGARQRIGTFPTDDPFFEGPCDNGTN